jgi:uncharacterized protein
MFKTALRTITARTLSLLSIASLSLLLGLSGTAHGQTSAADQPNPKLPMISIQAGFHIIKAEVAADPGTRAKGLMYRQKLGNNEGMIFIFERKAQHCFWMLNTPSALSIAFIDDDGTILNIENMAPRTEDSHCPLKSMRYALEMEQGWFAKKGIVAGSKLGNAELFGAKP